MSDSDLVMELMETLEGLRHYKIWYRGEPLPVGKRAMVLLMFLHHHLEEDSLGIQPSELGEILKLTRPAVTSLVNSLEEQGFVERIADAEDRRVVFVQPTSKGVALVQKTKREFARNIGEIMDHLGEEDSKELIRITRRVRQYLENRQRNLDGGDSSCGD